MMKSILDPSFRYTPSAQTNLAKKFAMWRRNYLRAWDEAHAENLRRDEQERKDKVSQLSKHNRRTA